MGKSKAFVSKWVQQYKLTKNVDEFEKHDSYTEKDECDYTFPKSFIKTTSRNKKNEAKRF